MLVKLTPSFYIDGVNSKFDKNVTANDTKLKFGVKTEL